MAIGREMDGVGAAVLCRGSGLGYIWNIKVQYDEGKN
jgi:hypothetical protein